jgi:CMP-N-acetylneuraminic acid synthetase
LNVATAPTLALVVARGGSKSIPRKNLAPLAGKPLLAWTIEAAHVCETEVRIVVSTDDAEIADVARAARAEVPFMRPPELARDDTPSIDVVLHAVEQLASGGYYPDRVLLLQPTSPLRAPDDIDAAFRLADERDATSVVSVCEARNHPWLTKRVTAGGLLEDFIAHEPVVRRQDLEPAFALNGAVYLTRTGWLRSHRSFYSEPTHAYVMPAERSVDVDEPWDLELCELILRKRLARD